MLVTRGGMESMLNTIWLIITALAFGGVVEKCGVLERDHDVVHALGQARILVQLLVSRSWHFAATSTPLARALDIQVAPVHHDLASLRAVPADFAALATRMLVAGDFGGGNHQQLLDQAATGVVHQLVDARASVLDQVEHRQQELTVLGETGPQPVFALLGDDVQRRARLGLKQRKRQFLLT